EHEPARGRPVGRVRGPGGQDLRGHRPRPDRPIPEEVVPSLFDPFRRLSGRAGAAEGTGFGLSIVRSVASAPPGPGTAPARPAGGLEACVLLPAQPIS